MKRPVEFSSEGVRLREDIYLSEVMTATGEWFRQYLPPC
jgi:hypothetical protein